MIDALIDSNTGVRTPISFFSLMIFSLNFL